MVEAINFIPVDDCVVVEIEKIETESNGLALPEAYVEKKQMSIVDGILAGIGDLAFYDLIKYEKQHPQIGDKVFFKRYSGILHSDKENNREFRVIRDQDIYAFERN